jgi:hypothetical protein
MVGEAAEAHFRQSIAERSLKRVHVAVALHTVKKLGQT